MKGLGWFLAVASLAFAIFSGVYGAEYDKVRHDTGFSWSSRAVDRSSDLDAIHAIVKPVSVAYYAIYLGFFFWSLRRSAWRKVCVLGIVGSAAMGLWSLGLDRALSFDEVFPAWIAAAVVLPGLQLIVSRTPQSRLVAPVGALLCTLALGAASDVQAAQGSAAPAQTRTAPKKATPAAATSGDVRVRKQLRAILEPHTDAMLRCEDIRSDFFKLIIDNASVEVSTRREEEWEACVHGIGATAIAAFKQTSASDRLQKAVWSEWMDAVAKRHAAQKTATASGGKP